MENHGKYSRGRHDHGDEEDVNRFLPLPPERKVKVRPLERGGSGSLIHLCRWMFNGVPLTPRSRRRHASRLGRESDNSERQRRTPVSNYFVQPRSNLQVADEPLRVSASSHLDRLLKYPEMSMVRQAARSRAGGCCRTAVRPNGDGVRGNAVNVNNSSSGRR